MEMHGNPSFSSFFPSFSRFFHRFPPFSMDFPWISHGFAYGLALEDESFDEIRWLWQPEALAKQHLADWVHMKKLTSRLEELAPGDWFAARRPPKEKRPRT